MDNLHIDILQQYVDDELEGRERVEVARHLGANARDRALVENYQCQNDALQHCYGDKLHDELPPSLQQFVDRMGKCAGKSSIGETSASEPSVADLLIQQAVQAHEFYSGVDGRPPSYDAQQQEHFNQWFEDRLQVRLCTPAFEDMGYAYSHAQCLPMVGGTAGQLTHRHEDGSLLVTYFQVLSKTSQSTDPLTASIIQQGELAIYCWQYETILYALVAAMHQDKLAKLAKSLLANLGSMPR